MGRYKELKDLRGKRGQGRKAKKQSDPNLPSIIEAKVDTSVPKVSSKLGGRIKQRLRKRAAKINMLKALQEERLKRKASKKNQLTKNVGKSEREETLGEGVSLEFGTLPFSDENQSWLTPAKAAATAKDKKKMKNKGKIMTKKVDLLDGGSDGNGSEDEDDEGKGL